MANNFRLANAAADAAAGDGSSVGLGGYIGSGAKIMFYIGTQNTTPESAPAGTKLGTCAVTGDTATPPTTTWIFSPSFRCSTSMVTLPVTRRTHRPPAREPAHRRRQERRLRRFHLPPHPLVRRSQKLRRTPRTVQDAETLPLHQVAATGPE